MDIETFNRGKFNSYIRPLLIKDRCEICNATQKLELHHDGKQFVEILDESLKLLNLEYKEFINEYSKSDLNKLENVMLGMQLKYKYKTLCKKCHNKEHSKKLTKIHRVKSLDQNKTIKIIKRQRDTMSITDSSYNMTVMQHRLLYLALKCCKTNEDYRAYVRVEEFKRIFIINSNNIYKNIKDISQSLDKISIKYIRNNKVYKDYIIKKSSYIDHGVLIEFNSKIINDLILEKLPHMDKLLVKSNFKINKKHSFRLYELLNTYIQKEYRDFDVEDLKFKLAINKDEYISYKDFKRRVIVPTIKELNEKSDLTISYHELERVKRSVSKIRFKIIKQ